MLPLAMKILSGYLKSMPSEEERRANGYLGNKNRDHGTFFYIITGCGVKHQRDYGQRFSGRMTLRVALVCRYLG